MRIVRYIIGGLLGYITLRSYFYGLGFLQNHDYYIFLDSIFPITLLDGLLIFIYYKGITLYGSNNKQRSRWLLISMLIILLFIALIFSYLQKLEADSQTELSHFYRLENQKQTMTIEKYKFSLDSCKKNSPN